MKSIVVDDEYWMIQEFEDMIAEFSEIELASSFQNPLKAIDYVKENSVDVAFLDIEMPEMNGIDLSIKLREINPDMIVIFISAYNEYMAEAFEQDADYFIVKPYNKEKLAKVVDRIVLLSGRLKRKVVIKTFGSFEVFVDDKPVVFKSKKAKELLAYLVDRQGSTVTTEEGFSILYEDKPYTHSNAAAYRKTLSRLNETLRSYSIENILYILPRGRAINCSAIECDYYQFNEGNEKVINSYQGEYMINYPWGEFTMAILDHKSKLYEE